MQIVVLIHMLRSMKGGVQVLGMGLVPVNVVVDVLLGVVNLVGVQILVVDVMMDTVQQQIVQVNVMVLRVR